MHGDANPILAQGHELEARSARQGAGAFTMTTCWRLVGDISPIDEHHDIAVSDTARAFSASVRRMRFTYAAKASIGSSRDGARPGPAEAHADHP